VRHAARVRPEPRSNPPWHKFRRVTKFLLDRKALLTQNFQIKNSSPLTFRTFRLPFTGMPSGFKACII
jgi:hypothetical protein